MKRYLGFLIIQFLLYKIIFAFVPQFGYHIDQGMLEHDPISEASGLAVSKANNNVFWTHNDSGDESRIYAFNQNGEHLGIYTLTGIIARDWEDIALGPGPQSGQDYLYIADIGDNGLQNQYKYIYRVAEPEVSADQDPVEQDLTTFDIFTFVYPDQQYFDAETIMIDPIELDIYIVTKRSDEDVDHIFRASYPQSTSVVIVMEEIADLSYPPANGFGAVGGDISSSGLEILIKTYQNVYYWSREVGSSLEESFSQEPLEVNYDPEPQGEAICWKPDGMGYYTVSEEPQSWLQSHLYLFPRLSSYISITDLPSDLYKLNDIFTIEWFPDDLECELFYATIPGGEEIDNYQATFLNGYGIIESSPTELEWGTGIYYCVLFNQEFNYISNEFQIIVESSNAAVMLSPENGSQLTDPTPVFSWETNPGVPYYFLVLSDNPFTIEEDENGDPVIYGVQPVWQIITPNTSALYGIPDPSGFFENVAQPLIPGIEYNWIVANNYGNDPLLTSKIVASPFSFTYSSLNTIPAPILINPIDDAYMNSEMILFEWSQVEEAADYQIFLYETREENGNIGNYLIWDQITTNTYYEFNAQAILINADYVWKVIATSGDGTSSVSENFGFHYDIEVGTLNLDVLNIYGAPIGFATAELDPLEGSSDNVPFAVNANGHEEKIIPTGTYILTCCKEGFESSDTLITIFEDPDLESSIGDTFVDVYLDYSPCIAYGRVIDQAGFLVENCTVQALSNDGEIRTTFAANGNYTLGLIPGIWSFSADASGYNLVSVIEQNILPGENLEIADLIMTSNQKDVQGYVKDNSGLSLTGVMIIAVKNGVTREVTSNSSGYFILEDLNLGEWTISAEKDGYISPPALVLEIMDFSPDLITMSDIVLIPYANLVLGRATNSVVGMEGVEIKAIPQSGIPVVDYTDVYGYYTLNLPQGIFQVNAFREDFTSQISYQLSLNVGETADNIDFILLPNNSIIQGYVYSDENGLPGAKISAGLAFSYSGSNGFYQLPVPAGTYEVIATKSGYTGGNAQTVSLNPGQTVSGINFNLVPNASIISGRVEHSGQPIAAATVKGIRLQTGNSIDNETSDNLGNYQLNLIAGDYLIWAEKNGYICSFGDTLQITLGPGQELINQDIELTPYQAFLSGITYRTDNTVLRSVVLTAVNQNDPQDITTTVSRNDGSFDLILNPLTTYEVTASKTGYITQQVITPFLEVNDSYQQDFYLNPLPSQISGKIYDEFSNPLMDALISADNDSLNFSTTSALNGYYELSLSYGEFDLEISKLGYIAEVDQIYLNPGNQITGLDYYLEENFGGIYGHVYDVNTGEPVENAMITANPTYRSTTYSDNDGFFELTTLLPGIYDLIIFKLDYEEEIIESIVIPGGYNVEIDAQLVPLSASLNVYVHSSVTRGLPGVTVSAENLNNGNVTSRITDSNGFCTLPNLMSEVLQNVSAVKLNYFAPDTLLFLEPDQTLELEFEMELINSIIAGTVRDPEDNALSEVQITAVSNSGFSGNATSDANGEYQINNLAPYQTYTVSAILPDYSTSGDTLIYLDQSYNQLDLLMYPNDLVISGRVVDQEEFILSGILVEASSANSSQTDLTDEQGIFSLIDLAPFTDYQISTSIYEQGYENTSLNISLNDQDLDIGDLIVSVHLSGINGYITDINTGEPIQGASITAYNTTTGNSYLTTSQPDGYYSLSYMYVGSYEITINRQFYFTYQTELDLQHREILNRDFLLQYSAPVTVSGTVYDTDQRIMNDIMVKIINSSQTIVDTTDEDGIFELAGVLPYTQNTISTDLPSEQYDNALIEFNLETEDEIIDLIIDIHASGVSGVITNPDGETIQSAQVQLSGNQIQAEMITLSDGYYSFDNLYEGGYQIDVYRSGYLDNSATLELSDFEQSIQDIQLDYEIGNISGLVYNNRGDFLKNAIVKVFDSTGSETGRDTTASGGSFSVGDLIQLNSYSVQTSKLGYQNYLHPDSVYVDSQDLEIELIPDPNSVLGTVYYLGIEIPQSQVNAKNLQGFQVTVDTDQFGDYKISNLAGYYDIWASYQDTLVSYPQSVLIYNGESDIIDLELITSARIQGTVIYNEVGKPGVTVFAVNTSSGRTFSDLTDINGNFDLIGLTPGYYIIDLEIDGFDVIEPLPELQIEEGEQVSLPDIYLTFIENSIAGAVYINEQRQGIADAVVKIYQNETVLDSIVTTNNGTYIFTDLADGEYLVSAEHYAYYNVDPQSVNLFNGVSNPPTINFLLDPIELTVFGNVFDPDNQPLSEAIVTIEGISQPCFYSDTTSSSGSYAVTVDTVGIYLASAQKENYYPSLEQELELDFENSSIQQNFILNPIPQFTSIQGSVEIYDHVWQDTFPPDNAVINLEGLSGYFDEIILETPDNEYVFTDLPVPNIYSLEINVTYQDNDFYQFISGIAVNDSTTIEQNFFFNYYLNSVDLSGFISIIDEQNLPLPAAKLILYESSGNVIDTTFTNSDGFYQFSDLTEAEYDLFISAQYNDEYFSDWVYDIEWTGNDLEVNYTFYYILSRIDFLITEDGFLPVQNASIGIQSQNIDLTLLTNLNGYCTTGNVLPSDNYVIDIDKDYGSSGRFIEPLSYILEIDSLGFYEQNKCLPLQFDTSQIMEKPIYEDIHLNLDKSEFYNDPVIFHYLDVNSDYDELDMTVENDSTLSIVVPAQNNSGQIVFWFTSYYEEEEIVYSNAAEPFIINIFSDGILSEEYSSISPENPIFVFNQLVQFQVDLADDNGNDLNELVDDLGQVEWTLSDSALGELLLDEQEIRFANLLTGSDNSQNLEGFIQAVVTLDNVSIDLAEPVKIIDMVIDHIIINGPEELHNQQTANYSATVVSNLNINIDLPVQWQELADYAGELYVNENRAYVEPADDFIGRFQLSVSAWDPNYGFQVDQTRQITCYQRINNLTPAGLLNTGKDSKVILYHQMLDTLQIQQADLYYNLKSVSPYQEVSEETEVVSNIFSMNCNRSQENFFILPGLRFTSENSITPEDLYIAYWDRNQLEWIEVETSLRQDYNEFSLDHVPILTANYGLLTPSKKLGLYDLKLRPNPFTPYDTIGENMGLQIEFKLSSTKTRYPRITAKIFTVNGTLVRTIAQDRPLLKGNYQAGNPQTLYWDGKTNEGRMARNGRYIIQLIAEDISHHQELVKTVTLIK